MNQNNRIKINQGRVIPFWPRFALTLVVVGLVFAVFNHFPEKQAVLLGIFGSLLLPPVWSTFKVLEVDTTSLQVSFYYWILGKKWKSQNATLQEPVRFQLFEKKRPDDIFSNRRPVRRDRSFMCYLKDSSGKLVFFMSANSYENLLKKIEPYVKQTGFDVYK